jgi:hypothetical protein
VSQESLAAGAQVPPPADSEERVVQPNPHSPYATADPTLRHLFPLFWWDALIEGPPIPGTLRLTGCGELSVVAEMVIEILPGESLPTGVCPACAAARLRDRPDTPIGPVQDCSTCWRRTNRGGQCASCRRKAHDAWWPTRHTDLDLTSRTDPET